jgi:hypothetical protein
MLLWDSGNTPPPENIHKEWTICNSDVYAHWIHRPSTVISAHAPTFPKLTHFFASSTKPRPPKTTNRALTHKLKDGWGTTFAKSRCRRNNRAILFCKRACIWWPGELEQRCLCISLLTHASRTARIFPYDNMPSWAENSPLFFNSQCLQLPP